MPGHNAIAVLGAGAWGTALALYLSRRGQTVHLWSVVKEEIDALLRDKVNNRFLPGFPFPETLQPKYTLQESLQHVEDVLVVVPSVGYRATLMQLQEANTPAIRVICATKGLDAKSGLLLNDVTQEILGEEQAFAVLSGPSFAREVAAGLPTAVVVASHQPAVIKAVVDRFDSPIFRVFSSNDIVGVEIGGITKNVIAVALGMVDGMNLGANARSAVLTFGFSEMIELGRALGAEYATLTGLAGLGDLVLTGLDDLSRNRRLGLALGKGEALADAERTIGQAVEGKNNAAFLINLAAKHSVSMPVCHTVSRVLTGEITAAAAIELFFNKGVG